MKAGKNWYHEEAMEMEEGLENRDESKNWTEQQKKRVAFLRQMASTIPGNHSGVSFALIVKKLGDLADATFFEACDLALDRCKWFPSIAELREFAHEIAEKHQRQVAEQKTRKMLTEAKPGIGFDLQELYAEIDRDRLALWEADRAFELPEDIKPDPYLAVQTVIIAQNSPTIAREVQRWLCGCPKHTAPIPERLFRACIARIRDAKAGNRPGSALEDGRKLIHAQKGRSST